MKVSVPRRFGKTDILRKAQQLIMQGKVAEARELIARMQPGVVVLEVNETTPGPARKRP